MISYNKTGHHLGAFHKLIATIALAATGVAFRIVPKEAMAASNPSYDTISATVYRNGVKVQSGSGNAAKITTETTDQGGSGNWVVNQPIAMTIEDENGFMPGDEVYLNLEPYNGGRNIGPFVLEIDLE